MKVLLKKRVGDLELEIEAEGKDEKDIWPQLEFWSSLPTEHPTGAKDFQIRARPAKTSAGKSVKYYEITCPSADQRFCFGQATDDAGGGLFPKGWEPIYHGNDSGNGNQEGDGYRQQEPTRQQRSPQRETAASNPVQNVDDQIHSQFQRLGIVNVGQEKQTIMKALNMKVGMLLVELQPTEKGDLLEWLEKQPTKEAA